MISFSGRPSFVRRRLRRRSCARWQGSRLLAVYIGQIPASASAAPGGAAVMGETFEQIADELKQADGYGHDYCLQEMVNQNSMVPSTSAGWPLLVPKPVVGGRRRQLPVDPFGDRGGGAGHGGGAGDAGPGAEGVVGRRDLDHLHLGRKRRELSGTAEGVASALHDQGRAAGGEQFGRAAGSEQR